MSFDVGQNYDKVTLTEKNKTIIYEPVNQDIKKLRPISIINDVAWIQVYLPTKQTVIDNKTGQTKTTLDIHPYYVTSQKKLINAKSKELTEKFQMPMSMTGGNVRWERPDLDKYLKESDKVNIKNIFEQIKNHISKLIELKSPDYLNVFVLWSIGTYFYKIFEFYPYLDFIASKGSGKSKALSVLECISYNAYMTYHLTGAAWSRIVESQGCTLLIDEQEGLQDPEREHTQNLTAILRAAFKTEAQTIINVPKAGGNWTPQLFDVGVPVALGHINPLHDVTADRTIPMPMMKSSNCEIVDAEINKDDNVWSSMRNSLYRMFLDYFIIVKKIKNERIDLPNASPRDRNQIWKPVITLARLFEREGIEGLVSSVSKVVEDTNNRRIVTNQSSNTDVQIIETLCQSLDDQIPCIDDKEEHQHWYSQRNILKIAQKDSELEYLSPRELGAILDRLGLRRKKKNPYSTCIFITYDLLKNLCEKYNLDFEALTAHKSHLTQPSDKSAASDESA